MPHLTLEYTAGSEGTLDVRRVLGELHLAVAELLPTRIENCKGRALRHEAFLCGAPGSQAHFVHLDVQVLEGRSTETRAAMTARLLALLRAAFETTAVTPQFTVNVREIDPAVYAKHLPGLVPAARTA